MDIVCREKVLASTCGKEIVDPAAGRIGGHRGDEFGAGAGFGEEGFDGVCCFLRSHLRGVEAHVRQIGFIEGKKPGRWVGTVDQVDSVCDVAGEGHHGDVVLFCA